VSKTKVPINETGYQFTKFACFDSDKDLILLKNMSCSGGISQSKFKTGVETSVVQFLILKGTFDSSFFTLIFES
jgi:hypothetical protein